jgi:hypothetical protein
MTSSNSSILAHVVGEHVEVFCPWCGTIHVHGTAPGGRSSHCLIGSREYNLIPTHSPMPEELRRAAAINRRRITRYLDRGGTYDPILPELDEVTP